MICRMYDMTTYRVDEIRLGLVYDGGAVEEQPTHDRNWSAIRDEYKEFFECRTPRDEALNLSRR